MDQGHYVLRIARRSMWQHRTRTAMTIAGIAVAVIAFGLLRTVVDSWYAGAALGNAGRLITRNAASLSFSLPLSYADRLRKVPGVEGVTWANWFGGVYQDNRNGFGNLAVDAASYFRLYPEFEVPAAQLSAFQRDRRGVVIGRKLAREFGWRLGDPVSLKGTIYPGTWTFVVRGIYRGADETTDERQFFLHWDYINDVVRGPLPSLGDRVGVFVVQAADPALCPALSAAIDSLFRNSLAETRTETQKAFQLGFIAMVDTVLVAIRTVAYVVLLIMMAVMANTMAMSARERTREYATLKALGFGNGFVNLVIVTEAQAISLVGGALGILLTFPVARMFYRATSKMFLVFEIAPATLLLQALAVIAIGAVAAIAPIVNTRRLMVVEGLRAT